MLLQTQHHLILPQKYLKVLHLCPAFNETFIMVAISHYRTQKIIHMDINGKIIKQRVYYDTYLQEMVMINDRTLIVLNRKQNLILQWNIQKDIFLQIPHLFLQQKQSQITYLYAFQQTNLICIVQLGSPNSNMFKLTYYLCPFQNSLNIEPQDVFQSQQVWTYTHIVRKGNNHSMICWVQTELQKHGQLKLYDLNQSGCNAQCRIQNMTDASDWHYFSNIQMSVGNIWEIRPMQFLLCSATDQNYSQQTNQYPNTLFVYSPLKESFRYFNFSLPASCHNQFIDAMNIGTFSIFRTYQFYKGQPLTTPIFYIDNQSQQVIATEQWQCSHIYKYQLPSWYHNGYIQCLYENGNVEQATVRCKEILSKKIIFAFFLQQIIGEQTQIDVMLQVCQMILQNI